jgi:hypothetical protein
LDCISTEFGELLIELADLLAGVKVIRWTAENIGQNQQAKPVPDAGFVARFASTEVWIWSSPIVSLGADAILRGPSRRGLMLQYKAGYKFVDGGVHAQVVDFPAVITCAADISEARRLLAAALLDVAETCLDLGRPLPPPDSSVTDPFEERISLHLSGGMR